MRRYPDIGILIVILCLLIISMVAYIGGRHNKIQNDITTSADRVVNMIHYTKDPRTGFCFAYTWPENSFGNGPSITLCPCEGIPKELFSIAEIN